MSASLRCAGLIALLLAGSCASTGGQTPKLRQTPSASPAALLFDCLRASQTTLVSAHRAGPGPGLPENALETISAAAAAGIPVVEIDIARSSDGVLVLMHDTGLERTSTGTGPLAARTAAELTALSLKDPAGALTSSRLPLLADALARVKAAGLFAQLDLKRSSGVTEAEVAAAARQAGVIGQVAIITYSDAEALAAAQADPQIMVSATVDDPADIAAFAAAGLVSSRLLAWTGFTRPDPVLWSAIRDAGVEVIFGTLGRSGDRLDDLYAADGDDSDYAVLAAQGVTMIATDRPHAAEAALRAARGGIAAFDRCPLPLQP